MDNVNTYFAPSPRRIRHTRTDKVFFPPYLRLALRSWPFDVKHVFVVDLAK